MLDFRVSSFLKVCQTMNFTQASSELHITQPAVSQHIRFLEEKYQVKLFNYQNRKLQLTREGEILRDRLKRIINDESRLKEELIASSTQRFSISIGVTMTVGEYALCEPLSLLLKKHPHWDVRVKFGNTEYLLSCLEEGLIDFGLVEGYYPKDKYRHMAFSTQPFIAVCSADHVFNVENPRELKDLLQERIIIREPGSGTREILERSLAIKGIKATDFSSSLEVGNMHTIIRLLQNDCGISFLYRIAAEKELAQGIIREIPLQDFQVTHCFDFIWEKGSIYSAQINNICQEIIEADQLFLSGKKW